jgi:hypothetical protein
MIGRRSARLASLGRWSCRLRASMAVLMSWLTWQVPDLRRALDLDMSVPIEPGPTAREVTCPNGHNFWRIDGELRPES